MRKERKKRWLMLMFEKKIAQRGAKKITGVDIDEELIRAAWSRRRKAWSLQQPQVCPTSNGENSSSTAPSNKKRKRGEEDQRSASNSISHRPLVVPDYFPASLVHSFGSLSIPEANSSPTTLPDTSSFPHNVGFRAANWVIEEIHEDKEGYDVVLA
jgi:7SK snRNA methylphosphate capping enzyme